MKKSNALLGLAGAIILISLVAWGYQVNSGLIVTNMRNPFSWGLYIATFAFFVGVAAGGLIVSSSVYLSSILNNSSPLPALLPFQLLQVF